MATNDVVLLASQLKKLTKDELINLIINKNVTQIAGLSEQTIEQLTYVLGSGNKTTSGENIDGGGGSAEQSRGELQCLAQKLSYVQNENDMLRKMSSQLEDRIGEQKLLIKVLEHNISLENFHRTTENNLRATPGLSILRTAETESVDNLIKVKSKSEKNRNISRNNKATTSDVQRAPVTKNHSNAQDIIRGCAPAPTVAVGSKQDTFAAVARRAYLYIGNINPNASKNSVVNYIRSRHSNGYFSLDELPKRDDALSRAYKLTIDFSVLEIFSKPDFWPEGVVVKRFFRPKTRQ